MGISNLVALFIMITTAATLNAHGVTDIQTSSQAADALRPIAGRFAFTIFALGIIGTGMLALPVLAGSAAYALGETLHWVVGLTQRPGRAPAFYMTIAAATLVGAALNFTPLDPVKALIWSADNQWRRSGADHGDDHAHGLAQISHGRVRAIEAACRPGMARDGCYGGRGGWDVCDLGKLSPHYPASSQGRNHGSPAA